MEKTNTDSMICEPALLGDNQPVILGSTFSKLQNLNKNLSYF